MAQTRRSKPDSETVAEWVAREQGRHFCQCGCGRPIVVKPHHHQPGYGIPKYLVQCVIRAVGRPSQAGTANSNWKGGRVRHSSGYVMTFCPGHPFVMKTGYVLEHRLVLERHLREADPQSPYLTEVDGTLYLRPEVVIHHADGIKDNNDPANLVPISRGEHMTLHNRQRWDSR